MWFAPAKYEKNLINLNDEYMSLKGELDDKLAKETLARFLRNNIGFTFELLTGIRLPAYEECIIKGFMNRNYSMMVAGRGCGKTTIAAFFSILQMIFEPRTKIVIAGPTFRTARAIFDEVERISERSEAKMLNDAFSLSAAKRRNDLHSWEINGGNIVAIPLNGEKIRGFRANVVIIDEYLLLTQDMIKNILMPFLVAPQNIGERLKIREIEDQLIYENEMEEEDRTTFQSTSKMIALSSASFTFEFLYENFKEWVSNIYNEQETESTYFVCQIGYEGIPQDMVEKTVIEEASSGGKENPAFLREYGAQFT
ncbi:MAG: terminase large subunit, partial [Nanoarchaeota archaeon]